MHPNNDSEEINNGEKSCHDVQQNAGYPRQLSKDFFHGLDGARSYAEKVRERRMSKVCFWPLKDRHGRASSENRLRLVTIKYTIAPQNSAKNTSTFK